MITASAGTVTVNLTANMADFNRKMEQARRESQAFDRQTQQTAAKAAANLRAMGGAATGAAQAMAPLRQQFTALRNVQVSYTNELTKSSQAAVAATKQTAAATRDLGTQAKGTKGDIMALNEASNSLGRTMVFLRQQFGFLGALSLGYAVYQLVDAFAQFESKMNNVKAVAAATGSEMFFLSERAKELGRSTRYSGAEIGEAMGNMAQAGLRTGEIFAGIKPVLDMASAGNLDLGTSAEIVTNIMTGMGVKVGDLNHATDVLTKTFIDSNSALGDLGFAFKYAAPAAATAKVEFEEVATALGLMSNSGVKGTTAGTALAGMLIRLAAPTTEASKRMKELGIRTIDNQGRMMKLIDILKQFEPVAKRGAQGIEDLYTIFGIRPLHGITALIREGSEEFTKFRENLDRALVAGTAADVAKTQLEGLRGALIELRAAAEGTAIAIGESGLGKALESMADSASAAFNKITDALRAMRSLNEQTTKDLRRNLGDMRDQMDTLNKSIEQAQGGGFFMKRNLPELEAQRKALQSNIDAAEEFVRLQRQLGETTLNPGGARKGAAPETEPEDPNARRMQAEEAESKRRAALNQLQQLESEYLEMTKQNRRLIEVESERELKKFQELLQKKLISQKEFETAREQLAVVTQKKLEELRQKDMQFIQDIGSAISSGLEGAFREFIRTGKVDFSELTRSILADIAVISLRMAVLQPLFGGGTGGMGGGQAGGLFGSLIGSLFHTGGTVGMGGGVKRMMPASMFIGAPRLHNGGKILGSDEVPAVLQRGERVIPAGANDNGPRVKVQIINNTGAQVREESTRNSDGEEIRRFVIEETNRGIARGSMDGSMRTRYGNQVVGTRR